MLHKPVPLNSGSSTEGPQPPDGPQRYFREATKYC